MNIRLLLNLGVVIILFSCTTNNTNVIKSNLPFEENEKIIRQYYEYFNTHEWAKLAAMYAEISEFKDPSMGTDLVKHSRLQIIEKYTE